MKKAIKNIAQIMHQIMANYNCSEGEAVNIFKVEVELESVPVVENYANYKNSQMFLMADFSVSCFGKTYHYELC